MKFEAIIAFECMNYVVEQPIINPIQEDNECFITKSRRHREDSEARDSIIWYRGHSCNYEKKGKHLMVENDSDHDQFKVVKF